MWHNHLSTLHEIHLSNYFSYLIGSLNWQFSKALCLKKYWFSIFKAVYVYLFLNLISNSLPGIAIFSFEKPDGKVGRREENWWEVERERRESNERMGS